MMEEIPFKHVQWGTMMKLANKLDPGSSVMGNNWKMLAEKLGYTTQQILCFESTQTTHGRNTIKVLEDYIRKEGSTINAVMQALKDIDRPDALGELEEDLPEIQKKYRESLDKKRHVDEAVEHEYHCSSMCSMCLSQQASYPSMPHRHLCQKPMGFPVRYPGSGGKSATKVIYTRNNSVPGVPSHHIGYGMDPPRKRCENMVPTQIRRQVSDSMVVHPCDNHSQFLGEPMDQGVSLGDDSPLPLAAGIMRAQQLDPRYAVNLRGTSMDSEASAAAKPLNYHGNNSSAFRQPLPGSGGTNRKLTLNIQSAAERGAKKYENMEEDHFFSPGPTPTTPISTPLDHLQELAKGKRFHPEEGFNNLMVMKKEQELLQQKEHCFKTDERSREAFPNHNQENEDKNELSKYLKHSKSMEPEGKMREPPNTFPLRIKSNSCSSSSQSSSSSSQMLMKSLSMPSDMKPAEYRRAFRHIKVFVTYSGDNKRHTQRVLNLCKCLEKNGFTCCVDIYHRKLQMDDKTGWYECRFQEADFILVVVSPKYKHEVDMCDTDNSENMDSDDESDTQNHQLHTKCIYRMMYREYLQTNGRKLRFIPILFEGMTEDLIPNWMVTRSVPRVYQWPKGYKDLMWRLTKPEEQIRLRPPTSSSEQDSLESYSESNNETD